MSMSWITICRCHAWRFLWRHSDHFGWLAVAGIVLTAASMAAQLPTIAVGGVVLTVVGLTLALAGSEGQF